MDRTKPEMNRTQLACLCLLASAFVLAALLIVRLPRLTPSAQAGLVDDKGRFNIMTVQTRATQESLLVIDQVNEKLLVYDIVQGRGAPGTFGRLNLLAVIDLPRDVFPSVNIPGGVNPRPIRPTP